MDKLTYFLESISNSAHYHQDWVIRAFAQSNVKEAGAEEPEYDYQLFSKDGQYAFSDPKSKEWITIESNTDRPLMYSGDMVTLKKGQLANVKEDITTTVGNVLYNAICLIYPFGDKIDFITGVVNVSDLEKTIVERLSDDVPKEQEESSKIYVRELAQYLKASYTLISYSQLFAPAASEYTMTGSPEAKAILEQRLKEHAHELDNPSAIAKIAKEVEVLDRAYIEQDPNKGFYQKDKSFQIVRMKAFYMHGIEFDFSGNKATFVRNALESEWDISKLPEMANSLRDGSFKRGAMTALGGEKTKIIIQVMTGAMIVEEDCGTALGVPVTLTKENVSDYIGSYALPTGKEKESFVLSRDSAAPYLGKELHIRSPLLCKAPDNNYCSKCMGEFVRGKEKALSAVAAEVGSVLQSVYMGAMHGTALKSNEYDIETALS